MLLGLLCGSSTSPSANRAALDEVERVAVGLGIETRAVTGWDEVPAFRAGDHADPTGAVASFRSQVDAVDALVVAAPEYAGGLAGSVKNALDWLVESSSVHRKPVGALSVGTTGGDFAIAQLVTTLSWQGAWPVATLGIAGPRPKMTDGRVTDEATLADLAAFTAAVVRAGQGTGEDRRSLVVATVERFGVDPARFGDID